MQAGLSFEGEREHWSLLYYVSDKNGIYRSDYNDPRDEHWEFYTLRGKNFLRTDIIIKQFVFLVNPQAEPGVLMTRNHEY